MLKAIKKESASILMPKYAEKRISFPKAAALPIIINSITIRLVEKRVVLITMACPLEDETF